MSGGREDAGLVDVALAERIAARAARHSGRPLVVGLCGAQGSGKSTTAAILAELLEQRGLTVALLSLDDLYLTRAERHRLARDVHPLLATRGVPGTHDVALGVSVLTNLGASGTVSLPRFDKARDDRASPEHWPRVIAPVDVILFEGWCVGAAPETDAALAQPVNALERDEDASAIWRRYVNDALRRDYPQLFGRIDLLILLAAPGFEVVHAWRLQQEDDLRRKAHGPALMDAADVERFIRHFERLTRHILREMPDRADILVQLDRDRRKRIVKG